MIPGNGVSRGSIAISDLVKGWEMSFVTPCTLHTAPDAARSSSRRGEVAPRHSIHGQLQRGVKGLGSLTIQRSLPVPVGAQ
eukprot:gene22164-biopygen2710